MERTQIFGDPADMGSDDDIMKEIADMEAEEAEAAAEEKELAEQYAEYKHLSKKKLSKKAMRFA